MSELRSRQTLQEATSCPSQSLQELKKNGFLPAFDSVYCLDMSCFLHLKEKIPAGSAKNIWVLYVYLSENCCFGSQT